MSVPTYSQVLQDALRLPPDDQARLREALEDAEATPDGASLPPRVLGLNRHDPRVLHDPEAELPEEYLGEQP
ncbi:MAG: hypothetical protein M3R24_04960 [Chloroflexota bacterium]|nr:hypothetical protein [Chloroflexota bacterium]